MRGTKDWSRSRDKECQLGCHMSLGDSWAWDVMKMFSEIGPASVAAPCIWKAESWGSTYLVGIILAQNQTVPLRGWSGSALSPAQDSGVSCTANISISVTLLPWLLTLALLWWFHTITSGHLNTSREKVSERTLSSHTPEIIINQPMAQTEKY